MTKFNQIRFVITVLVTMYCGMAISQSVDNSKLSQGVIDALQKRIVRKATATQERRDDQA